jgi:hypothetical protein
VIGTDEAGAIRVTPPAPRFPSPGFSSSRLLPFVSGSMVGAPARNQIQAVTNAELRAELRDASVQKLKACCAASG